MTSSNAYRGETAPRSPAIATVLALVSPGSAWAYVGRPGRGIAVNTAFVLLWVVFATIWATRGFSPVGPLGVFVVGWFTLLVMSALDVRAAAAKAGASFVPNDTNHPIVYAGIWLFTFALPLGALHLTFAEHVVSVDVVRDSSMAPTLFAGDRLLIDHRLDEGSPLAVGTLVAYRDPSGARRIGRIVGGPGDEIVVTWDIVFRNDSPAVHHVVPDPEGSGDAPSPNLAAETLANATYVIDVANVGHTAEPYRWTLKHDEFVVLNDNRRALEDSRRFDVIPRDRIEGIPTYVLYSNSNAGPRLPLAMELVAAPILGEPTRADRVGRRAQPFRGSVPPS